MRKRNLDNIKEHKINLLFICQTNLYFERSENPSQTEYLSFSYASQI